MNVSSKGLDAIISSFDSLDGKLVDICDKAVYKAAGLLADKLKANVQSLPIEQDANGKAPYKAGGKLYGITTTQQEDLVNSMGIAHFRNEGGVISTSIGFAGYGRTTSKKYPNGLPNRLLMRSIESGTSFRQKNPIVRQTITQTQKQAEETIKNEVTDNIKKEL